MAPFIRSPYNYDVKEASDASSVPTIGPSLTVQSQSEDADINVLMQRFGITGKFPENPFIPTYGDFTQVKDYRSAWEACANAAEAFMQYPADFRARFDNDPQLFLDFSENPVNIPEMVKLGMFKENSNVALSYRRGESAVSAAADRGSASPSSSSAPPGGVGAAVSNAGNGVPNASAQRGSSDAGGKAGST